MAEIDIWYVSALARCNFKCKYCAAGQPSRQESKHPPEWLVPPETHRRVVRWLTEQAHDIRLRVNSIGEPFTSNLFLDSITTLSHAPNIKFVEVLTNGSFRPSQLDDLAVRANLEKVSLWMTLHHEFMTPASLVESAVQASQRGAFVVVNALVFPDNVDAVSELVQRCRDRGIRFVTGAGVNFNHAYEARSHIPALDNPTPRVAELFSCENALGAAHAFAAAPNGQHCQAGSRYFYIAPDGHVYTCSTYSFMSRHHALGSTLDPGFTLSPRGDRWAPCSHPGRCRCPEDYHNLRAIQNDFSWPFPTLGLPIAWSAHRAEREALTNPTTVYTQDLHKVE